MSPLWQCGYSALNWQEALLEIRSASSSLAGLVFKDPRLAQAAAKNHGRIEIYRTGAVRWTICCRENRSFVNGRREWNSIYVAAKRKWVRALCVKISDSQFASFPISSKNQVPSCSAFNLCLHESEFERIQWLKTSHTGLRWAGRRHPTQPVIYNLCWNIWSRRRRGFLFHLYPATLAGLSTCCCHRTSCPFPTYQNSGQSHGP